MTGQSPEGLEGAPCRAPSGPPPTNLAELHARTLEYRRVLELAREKGIHRSKREFDDHLWARMAYEELVLDPEFMLEVVELAMQATGEVQTCS